MARGKGPRYDLVTPQAGTDDSRRLALASLGVLGAIEVDGKLLLVKRSYLGQRWQLPGGHVEPGETLASALIRELAEELTLEVTWLKFAGVCHSVYDKNVAFVFRVGSASASVRLASDEIIECGFFKPTCLPEPISVRTRVIIQKLVEGTPFAVTFLTPAQWAE